MTVYQKLADINVKYQLEDIYADFKPKTKEEEIFIEKGLDVYKALYAQYASEYLSEEEAKKLLKIISSNEEIIKKASKINNKILKSLS